MPESIQSKKRSRQPDKCSLCGGDHRAPTCPSPSTAHILDRLKLSDDKAEMLLSGQRYLSEATALKQELSDLEDFGKANLFILDTSSFCVRKEVVVSTWKEDQRELRDNIEMQQKQGFLSPLQFVKVSRDISTFNASLTRLDETSDYKYHLISPFIFDSLCRSPSSPLPPSLPSSPSPFSQNPGSPSNHSQSSATPVLSPPPPRSPHHISTPPPPPPPTPPPTPPPPPTPTPLQRKSFTSLRKSEQPTKQTKDHKEKEEAETAKKQNQMRQVQELLTDQILLQDGNVLEWKKSKVVEWAKGQLPKVSKTLINAVLVQIAYYKKTTPTGWVLKNQALPPPASKEGKTKSNRSSGRPKLLQNCGMNNQGMTCYVNASFQTLMQAAPLHLGDQILKMNTDNKFVSTVRRILQCMRTNQDTDVSKLLELVQNPDFQLNVQEDAGQFLQQLLQRFFSHVADDGVVVEVNKAEDMNLAIYGEADSTAVKRVIEQRHPHLKEHCPTDTMIEGLANTLKTASFQVLEIACSQCQLRTYKGQSQYVWDLKTPEVNSEGTNVVDLADLVERSSSSTLEKRCSCCSRTNDTEKNLHHNVTTKFLNTPSFVTFQVSHLDDNLQLGNLTVAFPASLTLDLSSLMMCNEASLFAISGVIWHKQLQQIGHYKALVKCANGWTVFDDKRVVRGKDFHELSESLLSEGCRPTVIFCTSTSQDKQFLLSSPSPNVDVDILADNTPNHTVRKAREIQPYLSFPTATEINDRLNELNQQNMVQDQFVNLYSAMFRCSTIFQHFCQSHGIFLLHSLLLQPLRENTKRKLPDNMNVAVFTIHLPLHWVLVVFDAASKTLWSYDSLGGQNSDAVDQVEKFLVYFHWTQNEKPLERKRLSGPKQKDGVNCGMFVCTMTEYLLITLKYLQPNTAKALHFLATHSSTLFEREDDSQQKRRRSLLFRYSGAIAQGETPLVQSHDFDQGPLQQYTNRTVQKLVQETWSLWELCAVCQEFIDKHSNKTQCSTCPRCFHQQCLVKEDSKRCHFCTK